MKQLYASHNYAQKHYHGLHFGISVFGKDWRLRHTANNDGTDD